MKINALSFGVAVSRSSVSESTPEEKPAASPAAPVGGLGSEALAVRAAQSTLARMEGIDQARVAEIRAALERGEIAFDAAKLARLIERHHGGRG